MRKTRLVIIIAVILFIAYVTTFNYGGCGVGGEVSSGSSGSITLSIPSVTTNPATDITQTTATLNGTVNPNGVGVFIYFQFGTTTVYGSTTNYQDIGSGTTPVNLSATITGLLPNTTYNFRIIATRGSGTGITYNGTNQTFTTTGLPPTCATNPATNINSNSAKLNGTVNPNGVATNAYFQWGLTTSYGSTTLSQPIGSGTSNFPVTTTITGLLGSTLYNFRVVGTNSSDTTYGNNLTFTTGAPFGSAPTCTSDDANNITYNSARLNGTVIPNGVVTNVYFNYGTTTSYGSSTTSQNIGSGITSVVVLSDISGLSSNTTYNFRVVGTSNSITTYGNNLTFTTTPPPPSSTTNTATNVTYNSARLNGTVNPNGYSTTAYFQWGATTSYGSSTTSQTIGGGTSNVPVQGDISGLLGSTLYNFRVAGINASGTTYGNNLTFTTTAPPPPTCTTNPATNITYNSATLNGTVNPNGVDTNAYFQWGTTTSYGNTTTSQAIGSGTSNVPVNADISGLSAITLYNFRCVATNAGGTTNGLNQTFTTAPPPPTCTTNPATNVTYNSARLNGAVNPNGLDTTAYFQWGTTTSYGSSTTSQPIGSETSNVLVQGDISGLSPNTTYYFRIVATNSAGTTNGANQTFTTGAAGSAPTVTTNPATNIININPLYPSSATLNGTVSPNGATTTAYFQWGLTTSYGNTTTSQTISSGTNVAVTTVITPLGAGNYNFRVVGTNSSGTTYGNNQTFTILPGGV